MEYMPPSVADLKAIMTPATAAESSRAHMTLATVRREVENSFKEMDLIVVPTTTSLPKPITASLKLEMGDRKPRKAYNFFDPATGCDNTVAFDVYGIPAVTLPCGFTKSGLPVGLMIAGPHFSEGKVLALAYAFQQATDWHRRRPVLRPETPVPPVVEAEIEAKETGTP